MGSSKGAQRHHVEVVHRPAEAQPTKDRVEPDRTVNDKPDLAASRQLLTGSAEPVKELLDRVASGVPREGLQEVGELVDQDEGLPRAVRQAGQDLRGRLAPVPRLDL